MLTNPTIWYSNNEVAQTCNCAEKGVIHIFAILINSEYVEKSEIGSNVRICIANAGGHFILSGGFKGVIKKEKLKICHIKASIASVIVSILVAIMTFVVLKETNNDLNKRVEKLENYYRCNQ
jgi:hypothetical protein